MNLALKSSLQTVGLFGLQREPVQLVLASSEDIRVTHNFPYLDSIVQDPKLSIQEVNSWTDLAAKGMNSHEKSIMRC